MLWLSDPGLGGFQVGSCTLCYLSLVSLSPSLSVSVSLPPSIPLSLSLSLCMSPSVPISVSVSFSISLCLPLCPMPCGHSVPPRFVNKVRAVPFVEGEDAQVTCTIEGVPHPQIRWAGVMRGWACLGQPLLSENQGWAACTQGLDG